MTSVHKRQIRKLRGAGEIRLGDQVYRRVEYVLIEFVEILESRVLSGISRVEGLTSAEGEVTHPQIKTMSGQTVSLVLEDGRLIDGVIESPYRNSARFRGWGGFQQRILSLTPRL